MAVLAGVPHVSVKVRVAGDIATEYEAPSDQAPVVGADPELSATHSYIEAKTGAEFGIEMTVTSDFSFPQGKNAVSMNVYIDGTWMAGKFIRDDFRLETTRTREIAEALCRAEQHGGEPSFKKFIFSSITTSETSSGEDIASEVERARGLGVIKVTLRVATTGEDVSWILSNGLQGQGRELPEKALKGRELSHQGSLAASTRKPESMCVKLNNIQELGTILFHYRSHEALQREMIIPRSPSPESRSPTPSSPVADGLSNLSEGEIRRLAEERLRDLQVKGEPRRIKREAESVPREVRPLKVVILDNGKEAFDLTEAED